MTNLGPQQPRLELDLQVQQVDRRDAEIEALRCSVDELSDELAVLRLALDARQVEILDAAVKDLAWEEIARAAWPDAFTAEDGHIAPPGQRSREEIEHENAELHLLCQLYGLDPAGAESDS